MTVIEVAVRGAHGRMGQAALRAIAQSEDLRCSVTLGREDTIDSFLGDSSLGEDGPRVALDLTVPAALDDGIPALLRAGLDVVVGTSGVSQRHLETWTELCAGLGRSVLVVPNFALGVVLLQQFATKAARLFPDVELIEMHHERKLDHPSGTACDTARRIAAARSQSPARRLARDEPERSPQVDGVPVHAVRLPGLLAHQLVVFGATGETLTLRHDTSDRAAFLPGILLALRHVQGLGGLRVGLEHVLDLEY